MVKGTLKFSATIRKTRKFTKSPYTRSRENELSDQAYEHALACCLNGLSQIDTTSSVTPTPSLPTSISSSSSSLGLESTKSAGQGRPAVGGSQSVHSDVSTISGDKVTLGLKTVKAFKER
jgi:hypothetical protein